MSEPDETAQQPPSRSPRHRVLKRGIIGFNGRHSTLECTVRNISDSGCAVTSDFAQKIPDTFELLIELDGLWYPCEVVWRRPPNVGIHFTGAPQPARLTRIQVVGQTSANTSRPSLRRKPVSP